MQGRGLSAAWQPARVKQEALDFYSSAAADESKPKMESAASLRRFSYTGSPVKQEVREDSRDHSVLVHLGLNSFKLKLPPSMAARSSAGALPEAQAPLRAAQRQAGPA